ncbi:cytochrome c reductase hinge protein [Cyanidioschyzon merolae strain 10D]|jgi:ubiquinol-cytochrome c reductase subunit 6|uniref:Cytochrome b-c1 complex subunit 6 n=1 Tax=Cyanidioschyzon merolae (strain NIES-3377 / 10D) TaxID=280699 RepID=M1VBJ6_CYAM1|nr:cytochrome c reductase hinge protein [Cyanidioschyzon merolae strain 10D]BAM79707.1 cytochrome c reductase hinge protein [Cyanidioschyzon merolae strain 10D]|eukprot:XP_005535993.1 cytochrome c reductase hinge protein [Cyanidioschyzon merolae strain 10D]
MSETVDPKVEIEESCRPQCIRQLIEYEDCTKRIENDPAGEAHCTGQYLDFWRCIDLCVASKLFVRLK